MSKVLSVDDEPGMLWIIREILEREGFTVIEASNGEECLRRVKEEKPDVVLLDVMMPGLDGWEVCKRLKEDDETKSIPVVISTVRSKDEDRVKSFEYAEAEWHLPRPFKNETLTDILKIASKGPSNIEQKIEEVVKKEKRRKKVLKMLNPKAMEYKYEF